MPLTPGMLEICEAGMSYGNVDQHLEQQSQKQNIFQVKYQPTNQNHNKGCGNSRKTWTLCFVSFFCKWLTGVVVSSPINKPVDLGHRASPVFWARARKEMPWVTVRFPRPCCMLMENWWFRLNCRSKFPISWWGEPFIPWLSYDREDLWLSLVFPYLRQGWTMHEAIQAEVVTVVAHHLM